MAILSPTPNDDKINGTKLADSINGLAGNDTLTGFAGNDTLLGGIGNDYLDGSTDNDLLLGDTGNDTLLGEAGNDSLDGGADNDKLDGGAGADTLNGGTGTDSLTGGDGNDVYLVDNIGDRVIELAKSTSGKDSVKSSIDYTLPVNVENLELTGLANLKATGNTAANLITGNEGDNLLNGGDGFDTLLGGDGDDTLNGGNGADTLTGGNGSDTYQINSREDTILEKEQGGDQDVVESSITYTLPAFVEILTLTGTATIDGIGNELDNTLEGNDASNELKGEDGNDSLSGHAGDDTLTGGAGDDTLDGGDGQDQVEYSGKQGDYNIIPGDEPETWVVEDSAGNEGSDRLTGIETLVFADGSLDLSEYGSAPPELSFEDISITEGNSGSKFVSVDFRLSKTTTEPVSVDFSTMDATATAGSDYEAQLSGVLRFEVGETRKKIDIKVLGDTEMETDETFFLQLVNPVGLELQKNMAKITLTNDDKPKVSITGLSTPEGNSGINTVLATVSLSASATDPVSVQYNTVDGTALAGSGDYTTAQGTLNFLKGEKSKTISLSIRGDTGIEPDEFFLVQLSNPLGATLDGQAAKITLTNDDATDQTGPNLTLSSDKTRLKTGETAIVRFNFSEAPQGFDASDIQVSGGTLGSFSGSGLSYSAVFSPNGTSSSLNVVNGSFTDAAGNVGTVVGSGLSFSLEQPQALPTLSLTDATVTEGQSGASFATLTVTLSTASSQPVSVNYSTQDGSATAGSDYVSTSNTLSFAPNQTTATIQVPILGDTQVEANESFKVNLSSPVNATLGSNNSAVVTVINDDAAAVVLPTLSISGVKVKEGNSGSSTANATVTLSAAFSETVTVNYATQDGTALANSDYIATSGTLSFRPGETSKTLPVSILGDTTVESDESFQMLLSAATHALLNPNAASGTVQISNDDTATAPVTSSYYAGQPVINLGSKYGKLIYPVQVDGGHWFYYWDRSGDGTSAHTKGAGYANSSDYTDHDWLDRLFQQDVNGRVEGEDGAPVVGKDGNTDNTYRYATINGVKLALPTVGYPEGIATSYGYQPGSKIGNTPASKGSTDDNEAYNDYLAIWDAYNGRGTGTVIDGTPPGWVDGNYYWSATPSASGHAYVFLDSGYVDDNFDYGNLYVALEVL